MLSLCDGIRVTGCYPAIDDGDKATFVDMVTPKYAQRHNDVWVQTLALVTNRAFLLMRRR